MKSSNKLDKLGIDVGEDTAAINRREFLKLSGLAGTGLVIGISLLNSGIANAEVAPPDFEPSVYLKIGSDGKIIIMAKNPEIGQGVKTSLPQIIAEELEVKWEQIEVQQAMLDNRFGSQFAGGSTAINTNFETLRRAGAAAREMLIEAAARKWRVSLDQCYAQEGFIHRKNSSEKFSYAELAADAAKLNVRENPKLKDKKDFKIIGKAIPGVDNKKIVTGTVEFGLDARPKGMLVASIERCPYYGGKVKSVDDAAALKVAGVQQVIKLDPAENPTMMVAGVAVIATNTWAAMKGRKALRVEWDLPAGEVESDERLRKKFEENLSKAGEVLRDEGNVAEIFSSAKHVHEAVFEAPFLAHAPMEPMNYIADVKADSVDCWGPTQVPGRVRSYAASITGVPQNKINVRMTRVGGGFGRRLMADYAYEAIFISKTIGKPVQVVWTREDDLRFDYYRPAGMYKIKAALDDHKKLVAWHINASTTSRGVFSNPNETVPSRTEVFPDGFPAGFVPNFKMEYTPVQSVVPRGAWRAPGHNVTAWIDQVFIDEMAALAGKDPVDFRLELLGDDKMMPYRDHGGPEYSTKRLKNVIRVCAEKADWYKPAPKGMYRGFACHFMFGAYVAEVVTISVPEPGKIKLENVVCVVDCGIVINRSGAMNQLEGGIIDGLSAALGQAVKLEGGKATVANFNNYPLLRMKDAPRKIEVFLVESEERPEGLGEMSLPPVAAALCNAIYAGTGKRVRKLPIELGENQQA